MVVANYIHDLYVINEGAKLKENVNILWFLLPFVAIVILLLVVLSGI
jgi:hypothetical protein